MRNLTNLTLCKRRKTAVTLIFLLLIVLKGFSQENDWGSWMDVDVMRKINSASFGLMGEFYTKNQLQSIERMSIGAKGEYAFTPAVSCGAGYLLMNYFKTGYHEYRNRLYAQTEYKKNISRLTFGLRERMQFTFYPETKDHLSETCAYWRNRFKIEYKNSQWKIEPVADIETFYLTGKSNQNGFDETRYSAGINIKVSGIQKLKVYGLLSDTHAEHFYVIGLDYSLKL